MFTKEELLVKLKSLRRLHEDDTEGKAFRDKIIDALEGLPFHQRSIISDFYIGGLSWVQVSGRMHYCPTHCKNIRRKAVEALLSVLNNT